MFLLLFTATSIYFITGDYGDGIFMAIAIFLVIAISIFQESRSRNAIETRNSANINIQLQRFGCVLRSAKTQYSSRF
jgi:magnesium-transporting ATPase (P-type)